MSVVNRREDVDRRVEYTAISNCHQVTYKGKVLNIHAAIHLAFVLGIRAGMSKPDVVGDYMSRWIHDRTLDATPEEMGRRHEKAIHAILFPLQWTADEWDELEGNTQEDDDS